MDACAVDGATKQFFKGKHAVPVVQPQDGEDLMLQMCQAQLQEALSVCRVV